MTISINCIGNGEKKSAVPKKAIYQKPIKSPKGLADRFGGLAADDMAFIKELDRQFATFGNNIKIKVVNENSTNSKNIKRTINGEVG